MPPESPNKKGGECIHTYRPRGNSVAFLEALKKTILTRLEAFGQTFWGVMRGEFLSEERGQSAEEPVGTLCAGMAKAKELLLYWQRKEEEC
jgi:hypothetical protein